MRLLKFVALLVLIAQLFVVILWTRLANPDMTETRLLLSYWWLYLPSVVGGFVGFWLAAKLERSLD